MLIFLYNGPLFLEC